MPTPDPCAGKLSRVTTRPHWMCRGGNGEKPCARFQYGIDGITPDFIDSDGTVSCAQKVIHTTSVGDDTAARAPKR